MDLRLRIGLLCLLTVGFFTAAQKINPVDFERRLGNVVKSSTNETQQLGERLDAEDSDLKRIQEDIIKQVHSAKMFAVGLVNLMNFRIKAWNSAIIKLHTTTRMLINTTQATATNETYIAAMLKMNLEDVLKKGETEDDCAVPDELHRHHLAVEVDVFRQMAFRAIDGTTRRIAKRRNALNVMFDWRI